MTKGIKELSNEQLLQYCANAKKTYAQCGGHHKAHMNNWFYSNYKEEMEIRKIEIPTDDELYAIGQFNGDGSY